MWRTSQKAHVGVCWAGVSGKREMSGQGIRKTEGRANPPKPPAPSQQLTFWWKPFEYAPGFPRGWLHGMSPSDPLSLQGKYIWVLRARASGSTASTQVSQVEMYSWTHPLALVDLFNLSPIYRRTQNWHVNITGKMVICQTATFLYLL